MARPVGGWWDEKRGVWLARLGDLSTKTGKAKVVVLRRPDGHLVAFGDTDGRDQAIARIMAERIRPMGPTVADVCNAYVAWQKDQGSSDRTVQGHWYQLGRFVDFEDAGVQYGTLAACSIVPSHLWRFKQSGRRQIRHLYMSVLACWRWASIPVEGRVPEVLIPRNTLAGIARPKKGPPQEVTEWSACRRILRMARGHARKKVGASPVRSRACRWIRVQALMAIAYSGARTGEAVRLEWSEIRWAEGVVVISRDKHKTGARTGKDRHFPILPRLMRVLRIIERWPHRNPRFVFATRWQGHPRIKDFWEWIRAGLKPYLARHGLDLPKGWRPYWLRHAFAVCALEEVGADLASSALGHSADVLRATYDHVSLKRVRNVGKAVDKARKRKE